MHVRAPGRVNLIGEHTDYNDGLALPMAINRAVRASVAPAAQGDGTIHFEQGAATPLTTDQTTRSQTFVRAIIEAVCAASGAEQLPFDVTISSDVPVGAGLASSAALGCAVAFGCDQQLAGASLNRLDLACIVQQAEHAALGTPCGMLDPIASLCARADHAMLLDCRSLAFDHIPLPPTDTAALLVVNTGVKHDLASSAYADRRATCEQAAKLLGVPALRDATLAMLDDAALDEEHRRCASHVITENTRVLLCASAFAQGDLRTVGDLMFASHESLRSVYRVSCDELDVLVEAAHAIREHSGTVYGARMTGGGFGGCAIVLCRADASDAVGSAISAAFADAFGRPPRVDLVHASDGATIDPDDQPSSSTS